jgi:hypothetical protein
MFPLRPSRVNANVPRNASLMARGNNHDEVVVITTDPERNSAQPAPARESLSHDFDSGSVTYDPFNNLEQNVTDTESEEIIPLEERVALGLGADFGFGLNMDGDDSDDDMYMSDVEPIDEEDMTTNQQQDGPQTAEIPDLVPGLRGLGDATVDQEDTEVLFDVEQLLQELIYQPGGYARDQPSEPLALGSPNLPPRPRRPAPLFGYAPRPTGRENEGPSPANATTRANHPGVATTEHGLLTENEPVNTPVLGERSRNTSAGRRRFVPLPGMAQGHCGPVLFR